MSDLTVASTLGVGFLLGARHAFDADHIAAVATIVSRHPSVRRSSLIGFLWGLGHAVGLLAVGIVMLGLGLTISKGVSIALEAVVGVMLVALGVALVGRIIRERWHVHVHRHADESHLHWHSHRSDAEHFHGHLSGAGVAPLLVGMAHGVAGSGSVALIAVAAVDSVWQGLIFLLIFGLGSILGMGVFGLAISVPLVVSATARGFAVPAIQGLAALGSMTIGMFILSGVIPV